MCNCAKKTALGDVFTDVLNYGKKTATDAANTVAEQSVGPVKEACRQGAIIAIKDYSIPVTAGIAAVLITTGAIGFFLGKHFKKKA